MANIANLLTDHMAIWTAADTEKKSGRGRASGNAGSVYGVKKLRELILELAVRGKLVPQDPNDEPANELLKRIQAEKAKLIAEGKLKKEKPLAPIGEDETPFELPIGWEWVRVSDVAFSQAGFAFKSNSFNELGNGLPLIRIRDVGQEFTGTYYDGEFREEFIVKTGDYLISMDGEFRVATWKLNDALLNQRVSRLIFYGKETSQDFVCHFLQNRLRELQGTKAYTTVDHLSGGQISNSVIGLPPLAEQHHIVAKVDELMALCDQLEQQHSNAQEAHETLVSQLLATLTQSQNAAEFNANWQRIYAHFDLLFTTEASTDALKQTLLQLAVMGKLVPQNPNDEPASELLKRIQAEKAKLIAEGKLKKEKPLAPITEDEKPFELPKGWEWARFPELGEFARGKSKHRPRNDPSLFNPPIYPLVQTGEVARAGYVIEDFHSKYSEIGLLQSRMWAKGTLCITIAANIADSAILGFDACFPDSVVGFSPSNVINSAKYFLYFMKTARENLLKFAPATAQKNINLEILESVLIPTPPLEEQHRIVAKVDALMALCDQLKTRIQQAKHQQQAIADALVAQALKPATAEIIDLATYRAAITCNIIKRMQHNHSFGRTFAMKLLYLSQQHIGFETHLEFEREAAGPFDKWIYDFERDGVAAGWFGRVEKPLSNGHTKIEYQVKSAIDEPVAFMNRVGSREQRNELERLFTLFSDKKTEEAEIAATLFAAWNDFLLNGVSPTDEQIIQEVRENWHPAKAKFLPEQLKQWLVWLRDNKIVPTGKGCKTIYQQKLIQ